MSAKAKSPEITVTNRAEIVSPSEARRGSIPGYVTDEQQSWTEEDQASGDSYFSISEEMQRLDSHLEQMETVLKQGGEVGKKLDFLTQELFREVNTTGSKAQNEAITHRVVEMKGIEKDSGAGTEPGLGSVEKSCREDLAAEIVSPSEARRGNILGYVTDEQRSGSEEDQASSTVISRPVLRRCERIRNGDRMHHGAE